MRHYHLRPHWEFTPQRQRWAIDAYDGADRWASTSFYDTKEEATKVLRRRRRRMARRDATVGS